MLLCFAFLFFSILIFPIFICIICYFVSIFADYTSPPLDITRPYNVTPAALHKLPSLDGDFNQSEDYLKRVNPLHSFIRTGYLRQKPKGNFALRAPKWPLVVR